MIAIRYLIGDATRPQGVGHKLIAHCCNDVGAWGAGFVISLSNRWATPEYTFCKHHTAGLDQLGSVQFAQVEPDITVVNIIGQTGITFEDGRPPVRYDALRVGFIAVRGFAQQLPASVHMPRLGCGLAGGKWSLVEEIVNEELIKHGIEAFVYDLPPAAIKPPVRRLNAA